jgi:hypothetical protein
MGEAILLVLGTVLGYLGHIGQERYTHKQQLKADDLAQVKALYVEFMKLRDLGDEPREARGMATALEARVVLLRNAKLRERVLLDLRNVRDLSIAANNPGRARTAWIEDVVDCLAAAARGDRLPEPGNDYKAQLFLAERRVMKLAPALAPLFAAMAADPEVAALAKERDAWEKRRRRRTGWRRILFWHQYR